MTGYTTRCGFVAVLGAPNVGKSTLVNRMVGSKVTIVSPKVQTTRFRVLGIVVRANVQMIVVDTPGIFMPRRRLDRAMVSSAWSGAQDADEILLLVDAVRGVEADTEAVVARLKSDRRRATAVINKVDRIDKRRLLALAEQLTSSDVFVTTFMISARTGDGVSDLEAYLSDNLPYGPWLFPEDQITDMPARLFAAELTREKLYLQLRQELPYAIAVETEGWVEQQDGSVRIDQVIYVLRSSQRAIVLGKKGERIKTVGQTARNELERLLERRVHLFLYVKVSPWIDDAGHYRDLGLDFNR